MIRVEEATRIVLAEAIKWQVDQVPFDWSMNRVLAEDLYADRDFPPYDRVSMDGIAIQYATFEKGQTEFKIESIAPAGAPKQQLQSPQNCIEVMTGGVLPELADTVIRYEDLEIENGVATLKIDTIRKGQNVHLQGFDQKKGALLLAEGAKISGAEIGIAATIGKATLKVLSPPAAIIISTGDELVQVHEQPLPHQIRRSNVHRIGTTLRSWGVDPDFQHLPDNKELLLDQLSAILAAYQVVILSGGVSKGKFDYLPEVLETLGVEKLFHGVAQRPGKPFWFGKSSAGSIIFALPGNPVSSFMCTYRYVQPWLEQCKGLDPFKNRPHAFLMEAVTFKPPLTYFLQVRLEHQPDGRIGAYPVSGNGSGDLANLVYADAFLELPADQTHFEKGALFPFLSYRNP